VAALSANPASSAMNDRPAALEEILNPDWRMPSAESEDTGASLD
jgi:hypothetical protein